MPSPSKQRASSGRGKGLFANGPNGLVEADGNDLEPAANGTVRQEISLQQGIPSEKAKDIVKYLKDAKLKKVQASIQGDQVRVTSPSRDDLQEAMRQLREQDFGVALQFGNYRG